MKRYAFLTSVLVLAACGGGGGGHSSGPAIYSSGERAPAFATTGMEAAFAMQENPTVNANNSALTGMASYTVGTAVNKDKLLDYVSGKLGEDVYSVDNYNSLTGRRSVARRAGSGNMLGDSVEDTKKKEAIATAKILQMKNVLYAMVNAENPETYVHNNREKVRQALVLFDKLSKDTDISGMTDSALFALAAVTKESVMTTFDTFDADNFDFTKETLENVVFQGSGGDSQFSFNIDDAGKITHVALLERPEYGNNDTGKKYFYNTSTGELTRVDRTSADEALRPTDQGRFARVGETKNFGTTYYQYAVDLGDHGLGGYTQPGELSRLVFYSDTPNLTGDALKTAIINAILQEGNELLNSQGGETPGDIESNQNKIDTIIDWYADKVNNGSYDPASDTEMSTIVASATLDGVGKDVGLKYADFGYATLSETVTKPDESVENNLQYTGYAGGYDTRKMNQDTPNTDLSGATFTGTVVAAVENKQLINNVKQPVQDMLVRGNGVLTYTVNGSNKAVHELVATNLKDVSNRNNDWYNITMTGTPGESLSFKFDGTGKNIPTQYQFFTGRPDGESMIIEHNETDSIASANQIVNTTASGAGFDMASADGLKAQNYRIEGSADPQYYGADSNAPTEATTTFSFSEEWHHSNDKNANEVAVYGAFGGKR